MASTREKRKEIARAMAMGFADKDIAAKSDVTPSYISQLKADEHFMDLVASYATEVSADASLQDKMAAQLDRIQQETLNIIENNLDKFNKPDMILRLFKDINGAKRPGSGILGNGGQDGSGAGGTTVVLQFPSFLANKMRQVQEVQAEVSENNEVVSVDGTELITASSGSVLKQLDNHNRNKASAISQREAKEFLRLNGDEPPGIDEF